MTLDPHILLLHIYCYFMILYQSNLSVKQLRHLLLSSGILVTHNLHMVQLLDLYIELLHTINVLHVSHFHE